MKTAPPPLDLRPVRVSITDTTTSETRTFDDDGAFDADGFQDYLWEGGNYACDCNRALLFARARGDVEDVEHPCGDSRFTVEITDPTGALLYDD